MVHQESIWGPEEYKDVSVSGCSASFLLLGPVNLWTAASSQASWPGKLDPEPMLALWYYMI